MSQRCLLFSVFCPVESPHTRQFEGLLFVGFCPNIVCRSPRFLTPCEDDEKAMAEDELQRLTDNQSSFSASFVLYFATLRWPEEDVSDEVWGVES